MRHHHPNRLFLGLYRWIQMPSRTMEVNRPKIPTRDPDLNTIKTCSMVRISNPMARQALMGVSWRSGCQRAKMIEVAKKLADAARAAVLSPEVKRRIENEGATPVGNSPEEFSRFVDSEIVRWRKVVQYAGAKPE